jgi:hypothetical protein
VFVPRFGSPEKVRPGTGREAGLDHRAQRNPGYTILWELGVSLAQGYFIQAPTGSRDYSFQGIVEKSEKEEDGNAATLDLE